MTDSEPQSIRNQSIRILYVDDEQDLLLITKFFLEHSGELMVDTITSAQKALDSLQIHSYDAIVSDYQMPGMDGIEFLKKVRQRYGDIPFILFTGRGREEVVIEAVNSGVDFYIQKGGEPKAQFTELSHKIGQAVKRKQAEQSLQDSEKRLSDIINFLPDATFAIDQSGQVIAWNRAIEEMTGVPSGEMLGKGNFEYAIPFYGTRRPILIDLINEPDEKIEQYYLNIYRNGTTIIAESDLPHPKGNRIVTLINACPLYNQAGEITGAIESIRDITERRRGEEALRFAQEKYTTAFHSSPDGIMISELESGRFIEINDATSHLYGYSPEEMIGKSARELGIWIRAEDRDTFLAHLKTQGRLINYELVERRKSGEMFNASVSAEIMFLEDKEYIISTIHDITERKRKEEELQNSYAILKGVVESPTDVVIFALDNRYRYIAFNENHRKTMKLIWGADISLGTSMPEYIKNPEDRKKAIFNFDRALSGESFTVSEMYGDTALERRWYEDIYNPIRDETGNIIGLTLILTDITAQKNAELSIQESEEKFRRFAKNAPDMLFRISLPDGIYEFMSPGSVLITGYSPEEFDSDPTLIQRVIHPAWQGYFRENWKDLLEKKVPPTYEFQIIDRVGTTRWVNQRNVLVTDTSGEPIALEGIVTDITGQKNAEQELRKSEQRFLAVTLNAGSWIWEIDTEGVYTYSSPAVEQILGYRTDELVGKVHFYDLFDPSVGDQQKAEAMQAFGSHEPFRDFVNLNRHKNQTLVLLKTSGTPVFDDNGVFSGYSGVDEDITVKKKTEDALLKANRQLNLLGHITRHDILNKISVILGYLALVEMECKDPVIFEYFKNIKLTTSAIKSQIEFTRIYKNLGTTEPQWFNVSTIIPRSQVPATIRLSAEALDYSVFADPMLEKVFFNLLDNSVRHGLQVTEIRVFCILSDENLVIVWEDNGVGIADEEKKLIFEQGFGKNSGLGLFLVKEILSLTDISIQETGIPGKGARFEISVPKGAYKREHDQYI